VSVSSFFLGRSNSPLCLGREGDIFFPSSKIQVRGTFLFVASLRPGRGPLSLCSPQPPQTDAVPHTTAINRFLSPFALTGRHPTQSLVSAFPLRRLLFSSISSKEKETFPFLPGAAKRVEPDPLSSPSPPGLPFCGHKVLFFPLLLGNYDRSRNFEGFFPSMECFHRGFFLLVFCRGAHILHVGRRECGVVAGGGLWGCCWVCLFPGIFFSSFSLTFPAFPFFSSPSRRYMGHVRLVLFFFCTPLDSSACGCTRTALLIHLVVPLANGSYNPLSGSGPGVWWHGGGLALVSFSPDVSPEIVALLLFFCSLPPLPTLPCHPPPLTNDRVTSLHLLPGSGAHRGTRIALPLPVPLVLFFSQWGSPFTSVWENTSRRRGLLFLPRDRRRMPSKTNRVVFFSSTPLL